MITADLERLKTSKNPREIVLLESDAIKELDYLFTTLRKFEPALRTILTHKYKAKDVAEAEGKQCIIAVRKLRHHEYTCFFRIEDLGIKIVDPYEHYDTLIYAPIWVVIEVLRKTLAGRKGAFLDAMGLEDVKAIGKRTYQDLMVLSDGFDELAGNIARLKVLMPGTRSHRR